MFNDIQGVLSLIFFFDILHVVAGLASIWTIVPPSANPSSQLNKALVQTLRRLDGIKCERIDKGRIWLDVTNPASLSDIDARSVRLVALEADVLKDGLSASQIIELVCGSNLQDRMSCAIAEWEAMGNVASTTAENINFCIQSTKWNSYIDPHQSSSSLANVLSARFGEIMGWQRVSKSQNPTLMFHLLMHDANVALEMIVLTRPVPIGELPKPGFKSAESFMVTKAADVHDRHVVVDPMCGRGTFLVEAATFWPGAFYYGVDASPEQLQDASLNCQAAKVDVDLRLGDATRLCHFPASSVDRIMCCPPFGRQFEKSSFLYGNLLCEWSRILVQDGSMVLVIDMGNVEQLREAITSSECEVVFQRTEFALGKIRATVLIVQKAAMDKRNANRQEVLPTNFEWEYGHRLQGRRLWNLFRSQALPRLKPIRPKGDDY